MEEQEEKKQKKKRGILLAIVIALMLISVGGCIAIQISSEDSKPSVEASVKVDKEVEEPLILDGGTSGKEHVKPIGDYIAPSTEAQVPPEEVEITEIIGEVEEKKTPLKSKKEDTNDRSMYRDSGNGNIPLVEATIDVPAKGYTDKTVDLKVASNSDIMSIEWSGTRNGKDITLSDYIDGGVSGTECKLRFKKNGTYLLRARMMDNHRREFERTSLISVYPVPEIAVEVSDVAYSGEPQVIKISSKYLEDCKLEVFASINGGEKVPYTSVSTGILTQDGGTLTFDTDSTSSVKLYVKVTDVLDRVFEYESNEFTLKPSPKFEISKLDDTYRNDTLVVSVTGIKGLEGRDIVWSLTKDNVPVKFEDCVVTPFTNSGGELKFSELGSYSLWGTVTDDLNRSFVYSQKLNIVNAPPTIPTTSYFITRPGVKNKFKVDLTAVSTDRDKDSIVYEWEGRTSDDFYPVGATELRVRAKDSVGLYSDWATVKFEVKNTTPTLPVPEYKLNRQPAINGKFKVELEASSLDADNEVITYEWKGASDDELYGFGDHEMQVQAIDVNGASSEWAVLKFSIVNKMPTKPEATVTVNRPGKNSLFSLEFTQSSTDPDGDSLTYVWEGKNDTGLYGLGVHNFRVQAIDEYKGHSEWTDIRLEIVNTKPTAPSTQYSVERPGKDGKFKVVFTPLSTDADGDELVYEYNGGDSGTYFPSGKSTVKVRAKDSVGEYSDYSNVEFEIVNSAPTDPLTTYTIDRKNGVNGKFKVNFTQVSTDADNEQITYEWKGRDKTDYYPFGVYEAQVQATDVNGAKSKWVKVPFEIINKVPTNPVVTFDVVRPATKGRFDVVFNTTSEDPDGDTFEYEWRGVSSDGKYTLGTHTVGVRAVDEYGGCSEWTDVTFEIVNTKPPMPTTSNSVTKLGVNNKFKVSFTQESIDVDGDEVTYEWIGRTGDDYYPVGVNSLKVRAKDSNGAYSDYSPVEFEIKNATPTVPETTLTVHRQPPVDTNKFKVDFTATSTDADGELIEYEWLDTAVDGNYGFGEHKPKVRAVDIHGATSAWKEIPFSIINKVPTAPVATTTIIRPTVNGKFKVDLTQLSTDPDGDTLTYRWENCTADNYYGLGEHILKVYAVDQFGGESLGTEVKFTVVNTPPTKPVVSTTVNRPAINSKFKVDFKTESTDIDGSLIEYLITPDPVDFMYTLGKHTVTVVAKDEHGGLSEPTLHEFEVINTPPTNPTATATVVKPGKEGKFKVNFTETGSTDADGDVIEYKWEGRSVDDIYALGSYTVRVYAVDINGAMSEKIPVHFDVVNVAPTAPTIVTATPTTTYNGAKTLVDFAVDGSVDSDGDVITYEWDGRGDDYFAKGTYSSVKARAKDPSGELSEWKPVTFTVVNRPPTEPTDASATVTKTARGGKTEVEFSVSGGTDPDGDILTYEWSGRTRSDFYSEGFFSVKVRTVDSEGAYSDWKLLNFEVIAPRLWVFNNGDVPDVTGGWNFYDGAGFGDGHIVASAYGLSKPSFSNKLFIDTSNYNRLRVVYSVRDSDDMSHNIRWSVFNKDMPYFDTKDQKVDYTYEFNSSGGYIEGSAKSLTHNFRVLRVYEIELFNSDTPIRTAIEPEEPTDGPPRQLDAELPVEPPEAPVGPTIESPVEPTIPEEPAEPPVEEPIVTEEPVQPTE